MISKVVDTVFKAEFLAKVSKSKKNKTKNRPSLDYLIFRSIIFFLFTNVKMTQTHTRRHTVKGTCEVEPSHVFYRLWMMVRFLRLWTYCLAWSKLVLSSFLGGEPSTSLTK